MLCFYFKRDIINSSFWLCFVFILKEVLLTLLLKFHLVIGHAFLQFDLIHFVKDFRYFLQSFLK